MPEINWIIFKKKLDFKKCLVYISQIATGILKRRFKENQLYSSRSGFRILWSG